VSRIETIDRSNWKTFVEAPLAVLMLAKTTCAHCAQWTEELASFLEDDRTYADVRFGKLYLDQPGLVEFKRDNPWLAEVDDLPTNVLYRRGERVKTWAGGGLERLRGRLDGVRGAA
jgi:hypothetical protein